MRSIDSGLHLDRRVRNMKRLSSVLLVGVLLGGCGGDADKVEKLEEQVKELEERVEDLEALLKQDAEGTEGSPSSFRSALLSDPEAPDLDNPRVRERILAEALWYGIDGDLELHDGLYCKRGSSTPFTGWLYGKINGKVMHLTHVRNGIWDGMSTGWYESGQKRFQRRYENGKLMSFHAWRPNGARHPQNVVNGNGIVVWLEEDGTERSRNFYKDGEAVE